MKNKNKPRKKIVCIDFDGVIHSYKSKWQGMCVINDEPVRGAFEFLVELLEAGFQPAILSSRSGSWFGRRAMKKWFVSWLIVDLDLEPMVPGKWKSKILALGDHMTPWHILVKEAAEAFVKKLSFPSKKPPAHVTIDDRAIPFVGVFPSIEEIKTFQTWQEQDDALKKLKHVSVVDGGKRCFWGIVKIPYWEWENEYQRQYAEIAKISTVSPAMRGVQEEDCSLDGSLPKDTPV